MPRVKRGKTHLKKRKRLLARAEGFKWGRKNLPKLAKTAVTKAGAHAFRDRRIKKRTARALWQIKINAKARELGLTYSKLIAGLKNNKIEIDRKILANLAEKEPKVFEMIIKEIAKI